MIRYGTGQIFWNSHLSVNWTRNINSKKIQSNVTLRSNWDMFLFSFVFPALEAPYSKFKNTAIPKYLPFSLPYPIIYNHVSIFKLHTYLGEGLVPLNMVSKVGVSWRLTSASNSNPLAVSVFKEIHSSWCLHFIKKALRPWA